MGETGGFLKTAENVYRFWRSFFVAVGIEPE